MAALGFFITPNLSHSKESAAWFFCGITRDNPKCREINAMAVSVPLFGLTVH